MSSYDPQYSHFRRSSQLNSTVLKAFLEGGYSILFLFTLHKYYSVPKETRRNRGPRQTIMMSLIIMLYVCVMITMGTDWSTLNFAFVTNGETSDSVLDALNDAPLVANLLPNVAKTIAILIADTILIWRCWVVWLRSWAIISPLILLTLAFLVLSLLELIAIALPTAPFSSPQTVPQIIIAIFSLTLATTVLGTTLILIRIFQLGQVDLNRYRNAIELIVESSALYSLSVVFVLPYEVLSADIVKSFPLKFILAINGAMVGIAPTLLFVRVISGAARPDDSWFPNLTSLPEQSIHCTIPTTEDLESAESTPTGQKSGQLASEGLWHYHNGSTKGDHQEHHELSQMTVALAV